MDLFSKEKKSQLYFRDDNKFKFVKREIGFSCLLEKTKDTLKRGWKHFYGNQFFFLGYKKMSADTVTLGFARDIILDPFNKVSVGTAAGDKPDLKVAGSLQKWIATIAENQRHTYRSKRPTTMKTDIVNWSLIFVLFIMIVAWLITFMKGMF